MNIEEQNLEILVDFMDLNTGLVFKTKEGIRFLAARTHFKFSMSQLNLKRTLNFEVKKLNILGYNYKLLK